jgi:MFS superfamily sulfate permease-like transporter
MSTNSNQIPKDGLEGMKQNFLADLQSGFMVFLLALPLSLGIAKASGIPNPIFGVITAIIGGIIVSFLSGSRLTIKGPAAGLIPIISGCVVAFGGGEQGWHLALGCIVVASVIQVLFGLLKMGNFADFFPGAAIHGMLASIGIMIIIKQLPILFGVAGNFLKDAHTGVVDPATGLPDPKTMKGYDIVGLVKNMPSILSHYDQHLLIIGVISLVIVFGFSFIKSGFLKKIPAPLIVIIVAITLGISFMVKDTPGALVKTGRLTDILSTQFINVDFSGISSIPGVFIKWVIFIALVGSLESLLTVKAIDGLDPWKRKSNANKDLTGVGIGNTLTGLIGGSPMIAEVVRSSANIGFGAKTRWANFFHGMFLLLALLVAVPIIEVIPYPALAALLIFAGYRLASPKEFRHMLHLGMDQFIIFIVTIIVCAADDLLVGVATGIVLELILNIVSGAKIGNLFKSRAVVEEKNSNQLVVRVTGDALFSNYLGLKKKIVELQKGKNVTIDLAQCKVIDHTTLNSLHELQHDYESEGGTMIILNHEHHVAKGKSETSTKVLKLG